MGVEQKKAIVINPPEGFKNPGYPLDFKRNNWPEYFIIPPEKTEFEKVAAELNSINCTSAELSQLRTGLRLGSIIFEDLINPEKRTDFLEKIQTSIHEVSHAFLVKVGGGLTTLVSIISDGNTLGVTKYFRGSNNPIDNIATSEAGGIGAEEFGFSPDGCGSDHAHSRYTAAVHGDLGLISQGRQRARSAISSAKEVIEQRAHYLYKQGSVSGF